MKKLIALLLAAALCLSLTACGGKSEAAQAADDLINAIGTVTLDSADKIEAAEKAVNALAAKDAEQVENTAALAQARKDYDALVAQKAAEEAAKAAAEAAEKVDAAINSIGVITMESQAAIDAAWKAYKALDAQAQALVTKLDDLKAAEAALSSMRVAEVESLINAIGTVSLNSGSAIDAAQTALSALSTGDAAKVTNVAALTAAAQQLKDLQQKEAEKLLKTMAVEEDVVRGMSFYYPSAFPRGPEYWYADVRSFVLPYMGKQGNDVWLRLVCNYTDDDWVFFEKITFAVDEERYYDSFKYYDVTRDNDSGDVWEYVDIEVGASELEMLNAIANSTRTIVRFEGDDYYRDVTISQADKDAIRQVLTVYEALGGK